MSGSMTRTQTGGEAGPLVNGRTLAAGEIKVGIIGLSVHSADFTEILNGDEAGGSLGNCRVVSIYHPRGNDDVEFSPRQLEQFTTRIKAKGVSFVPSIDAVVEQSDAIMLLTNDGRPHLEQVLPAFRAGKPVYIDKPVADSLSNVKAIYDVGKQYGAPVFSSSALRYSVTVQDIAAGKTIGEVLGAQTHGPAPLQASHVDMFWDGIHGIEMLYTVMGTGCQWVARTAIPEGDILVGGWPGDRLGLFRGIRKGRGGFGGTAFGTGGIASMGTFGGYRMLVEHIATFFQTHTPPVSPQETLEIYAFMEAADESKRRGGVRVMLSEVN